MFKKMKNILSGEEGFTLAGLILCIFILVLVVLAVLAVLKIVSVRAVLIVFGIEAFLVVGFILLWKMVKK